MLPAQIKVGAGLPASTEVFPLTEQELLFCVRVGSYDSNGQWIEPWEAYRKVYDTDKFGRHALTRAQATKAADELMSKQTIHDTVHVFRSEAAKKLHDKICQYGIAVTAVRVQRKNQDWLKIQKIKEARAEIAETQINVINSLRSKIASAEEVGDDAEVARLRELMEAVTVDYVPGTETGLMATDVKIIGNGDQSERVVVAKFDKAMMDAQLELEKSVAEELGQRNAPAVVVQKAYIGFNPEDV
jgi:hypothetical protein